MTAPGGGPGDPTRVTDQASLTSSSGRIWLVVGAIALVVYSGVLLAVSRVDESVPRIAIVLDLALYLAMVAARLALRPGRGRLGTMAGLFLAMSFVSLAALVIVILAATAAG